MNMTRTIYYFIAVLISFSASSMAAQTPLAEAVRKADIPPAWPDCEPKLTDCTKSRLGEFIAANLQIPPDAKAQGAGGVVMMEFVVEKNGTIGEAKPVHDPGLGLGTEALRVINLMKTKKIKWTPAEENGKKVAFRYTVPVSFNLNIPSAPRQTAPESAPMPADGIYNVADVMPTFAGCQGVVNDSIDCTFTKVVNHIKTNLKYPEEAVKHKVEGQVVTEFVVDTTGEITNAVIKKGLGHGCDEEALRVLMLMHNWNPGQIDGKPVKVRMVLPIVFQLPKK
jgi:protein TonB